MLSNASQWSKLNKTGLQPVSRPVEQILGFFPKGSIMGLVQRVSLIMCCTKGAAKPVFKPLETN